MSAALIQTHSFGPNGGNGPFTTSMTSNPQDGNHIILCASQFGSREITDISQTGVTWTKIEESFSDGGGFPSGDTKTTIWLGVVGPSADDSITISVDNFDRPAFFFAEYAGLTSSPVDQTAINAGTASPADSGTTATTTTPEQLWIAALGIDDSQNASFDGSPTNGFSVLGSASNADSDDDAHAVEALSKSVTSTGTANTSDSITGSFESWAGAIATFEVVPTVVSTISPQDNDINVESDVEVVFNITAGSTIDLSTLIVDTTTNIFLRAIENGEFVNNFTGEFIDNLGDGTDITVVIIRPISSPRWPSGTKVQIDISGPASLSYSFTVKSFRLSDPDPYTEELDLTSLPSGYSTQSTGTGSAPTFDVDGMTTNPGADGSSFIENTSIGLDFDLGLLIDVEVFGVGENTKVLQVNNDDKGVVSVNVDFVNGEIYLSDIVNTPPPGFRPGVKNDIIGEIGVQFRLTIKNSGDNLIARLYSGVTDASEAILLKQTGGPSILKDPNIDSILIGTIEGDSVRIPTVNILNQEDPDQFYPFPQITNIFPTTDVISGGKKFRLQFADSIDFGAGTELLAVSETFRDESSGAGSFSVDDGVLTLSLSGTGTAAVRFMRSYSGDLPSASDIRVDVSVDPTVLESPPQDEVILAAIRFLANGDTVTAEYVSDFREGSFFRIVRTSGGLQSSNFIALNSSKVNFTFRILRAGNTLSMFVDNTSILNTSFKDGVGIVELFSKSNSSINFNTEFTNFIVRPVVVIGNTIVA